MLTKAQIDAAQALLASGHLKTSAQAQLLLLIRSLPDYRTRSSLYPNLAAKLAAAEGMTAQILQAALTAIEAVGAGEESLGSASTAGVSWSRAANRNEFIMDALNALYDVPLRRPASAVVPMQSSVVSICPLCGYGYSTSGLCGCRGNNIAIIQ